jgi:F0F1-type ATP synthase assembly protein I
MFSNISAVLRKVVFSSMLMAVTIATQQSAIAAGANARTNNADNRAANVNTAMVLSAGIASQLIDGILYTEGQIGLMADRILYTENLIVQVITIRNQ